MRLSTCAVCGGPIVHYEDERGWLHRTVNAMKDGIHRPKPIPDEEGKSMSETAPVRRKEWEGTCVGTTEGKLIVVLDGETVPTAHEGRRVYVPISAAWLAALTKNNGKKNKKGGKKK